MTLSPKEMTSKEKLDYIYLTLKSFQELLPKTENVVLDVNDDKLHQLSARTLISLDFLDFATFTNTQNEHNNF